METCTWTHGLLVAIQVSPNQNFQNFPPRWLWWCWRCWIRYHRVLPQSACSPEHICTKSGNQLRHRRVQDLEFQTNKEAPKFEKWMKYSYTSRVKRWLIDSVPAHLKLFGLRTQPESISTAQKCPGSEFMSHSTWPMFVRSSAKEAEKQLVDLTMKRNNFTRPSLQDLNLKTIPLISFEMLSKNLLDFRAPMGQHRPSKNEKETKTAAEFSVKLFYFRTPDAAAATGVLQLAHPLGGRSRHLHSPGLDVTCDSPMRIFTGKRLEKAPKCLLNCLTQILWFYKICCIIIFCWQLEIIWRVPTLYSSSDRNGKEEIAKTQFNRTAVRIFMACLGCTNDKATNGKDSPQHEQKSHTFRPQNTSSSISLQVWRLG